MGAMGYGGIKILRNSNQNLIGLLLDFAFVAYAVLADVGILKRSYKSKQASRHLSQGLPLR